MEKLIEIGGYFVKESALKNWGKGTHVDETETRKNIKRGFVDSGFGNLLDFETQQSRQHQIKDDAGNDK